MNEPASIATEAIWTKQALLKPGINQVEVNEIATAVLSALYEKGHPTIRAGDLWDFDDALNRWFNLGPENSRLRTFDPLPEWQTILRQMPRRKKS